MAGWQEPRGFGLGRATRRSGWFFPDGRYVLFTNGYIHHGLVDAPPGVAFHALRPHGRKPVWSISKKLGPNDWPDVGMCVFSPDGKWVVTGRDHGQGKEVRLWDAPTGKQLWQLRNKGPGQSLSRTPIGFVDDGETVVLRDYDGTFSLFDRATGTERKSFPTAPRQSWGQTLLSPDGRHVVTCTVQPPSVWDLDGKKVAVLEGHKVVGEFGRVLAGRQKTVYRLLRSFVIEREWPSGKPVRKIELDRDRVVRLAVSPDGKRLEVVFEGEQALIFYDLETGKRLPELIDCHRATDLRSRVCSRRFARLLRGRPIRPDLGPQNGQSRRPVRGRSRPERPRFRPQRRRPAGRRSQF